MEHEGLAPSGRWIQSPGPVTMTCPIRQRATASSEAVALLLAIHQIDYLSRTRPRKERLQGAVPSVLVIRQTNYFTRYLNAATRRLHGPSYPQQAGCW